MNGSWTSRLRTYIYIYDIYIYGERKREMDDERFNGLRLEGWAT